MTPLCDSPYCSPKLIDLQNQNFFLGKQWSKEEKKPNNTDYVVFGDELLYINQPDRVVHINDHQQTYSVQKSEHSF